MAGPKEMVKPRGADASPDPLAVALGNHQAGRFAEAEVGYQRLVEVCPDHADAWHLWGVLAAQQKQFKSAVERIQRALDLRPHEPLFLGNLGNAFLDEGQLGRAITCYQEALQLRPDEAEIRKRLARACELQLDLGIGYQRAGQLADAEACYQDVLRGQPERADAWHLMAVIASERGQYDTAIERMGRAIELAPNSATFYISLGNVHAQRRRFAEAVTAYRKALELRPIDSMVHGHLALAQRALGQLPGAIASLRQAIALDPGNVEAHMRLADALREMGNHGEAITAAQQAVELDPSDARVYGQLGVVLRGVGRTTEAIQACRRSLELAPGTAGTHNNLAMLFKDQARIHEALACYQQALQLDPSKASVHSNLLFNLHYAEPYDAPAIYAAHRQWAQRHSASAAVLARSVVGDKNPDKRLRIGYVSADLRSHSVAFFLESILAARNQREFEVLCYSNSVAADTTTARLRALVDGWRDIAGLDDEQAAGVIRSDAIDILVDLAGHTKDNRLPLFTRKPAPIQITYLGYPDTTGIEAIDYRLTDEWADPPGQTEHLHSERLVRLPDGFLCYQPPSSCPPVGPLPLLQSGRVTFGSFNNLAKVSPTVIGYWAAILAAVPGSRLLLKSKALADSGTRKYIHQQFCAHGIEAGRVELVGWTPARVDHMALYSEVDIALDTFPYHGATTTCEALWMGVPVVTLAGPVHVSRVGVSLLHAAGLAELIAESPQEYARKAAELVADTGRLAALRGDLRERLRASRLTDAQRITASIEVAYRDMWRRFCAATAPISADTRAVSLNVSGKTARDD